MKIGITERGDASIDYSWVNKLDKVDGAIIITKNLTDKFIHTIVEQSKNHNLILHKTLTERFHLSRWDMNVKTVYN